jgi:surface antigen
VIFARPTALAATGVALSLVFALGGHVSPARAAFVCVDDDCDSGLWSAARGPANDISYWGMTPGHNCTNFVAWKLILNGVPRPATNPGNAADWAARARADGYLVDSTPSVGSVAQWTAFQGGSPIEGHVAYVEKVNDDGTILVSEDAWHADGSGPMRFRVLAASSVSNFIHYADSAAWMRQVVASPGIWSERSTGQLAKATLMSAVSMGGSTPTVAFTEADELRLMTADASGWHLARTGLASHARALSAVNMGGSAPVIVALEGPKLMMYTRTRSAWVSMYTGIDVTGTISAVNAGGQWPTVMVSQGSELYSVTNTGSGWSVQSTGLAASSTISAASTSGSLLDVYSVDDGTLFRMWSDGTHWHRDATGILTSGTPSAVAIDGTTQLVLSEAGSLWFVYRDLLGWNKVPTGIAAGSAMTAVSMGGLYPVIFQTG